MSKPASSVMHDPTQHPELAASDVAAYGAGASLKKLGIAVCKKFESKLKKVFDNICREKPGTRSAKFIVTIDKKSHVIRYRMYGRGAIDYSKLGTFYQVILQKVTRSYRARSAGTRTSTHISTMSNDPNPLKTVTRLKAAP